MDIQIITEFKATWEWFISLIARIFGETFDYILAEKGIE